MINKILSKNPIYHFEIMRFLCNRGFLYGFFLIGALHFIVLSSKLQYGESFLGLVPAYICFPFINFIYAFMLLGSFALSFLHENNHKNDDLMIITGLTPQRIVQGRFLAFITLLLLNVFMSLPFCLLSFYNHHYSLHPNCFFLPLCTLITIPVYQIMSILAATPNKYLRNGLTLFWLPIAALIIIKGFLNYFNGLNIHQIELAPLMTVSSGIIILVISSSLYLFKLMLIARNETVPSLQYKVFLFVTYIFSCMLLPNTKIFQLGLNIYLSHLFFVSYRFKKYDKKNVMVNNKQTIYNKLLQFQSIKNYNLYIWFLIGFLGLIPIYINGWNSASLGHNLLFLLYPFFIFLAEWGYQRNKYLQKHYYGFKSMIMLYLIAFEILAVRLAEGWLSISTWCGQKETYSIRMLYISCTAYGIYKLIRVSLEKGK